MPDDALRARLVALTDGMVRVGDSLEAIARDALAALDAQPPVFPPGAPARAGALRTALRAAYDALDATEGDDRRFTARDILQRAIADDTAAWHAATRKKR